MEIDPYTHITIDIAAEVPFRAILPNIIVTSPMRVLKCEFIKHKLDFKVNKT